jgi:hypothetical protein
MKLFLQPVPLSPDVSYDGVDKSMVRSTAEVSSAAASGLSHSSHADLEVTEDGCEWSMLVADSDTR